MRIRVHKLGLDWAMTCTDHRERVWCETHADAYEVAAGHAVMHHPRTDSEIDAAIEAATNHLLHGRTNNA